MFIGIGVISREQESETAENAARTSSKGILVVSQRGKDIIDQFLKKTLQLLSDLGCCVCITRRDW